MDRLGFVKVTAGRLRVAQHARIERIAEEIKALNEAKKEILAEAICGGFEVKKLKVLRLRKLDKAELDKRVSLLDLYLRAMESAGAPGVKAV